MPQYDWKKNDKALYLPKAAPTPISVPRMKYFKVCGEGGPGAPSFREAVETLYTVSYSLKMYTKKHPAPAGWYDYAVFPLEGTWRIAQGGNTGDKSSYLFDMMIRQPDFLDSALEDAVREIAAKKKPALPWRLLEAIEQEEGECLQMLHVGSYDDEPRTFAIMDAYCREHGLTRRSDEHKEIYLNDPNRTAPEKLKTALRYWVKPVSNEDRAIRGCNG